MALLGSTALVAASIAFADPALAQEVWLANPGSSDFNTAANWDPASVPVGTAVFDASSVTTLTFSGNRNIDTFQFNAGAPAYTFDLTGGFGVRFNGDGIVNFSSNAPTFNVDSSILEFDNAASAGNAIINITGGTVRFLANSTPGAAQLTAGTGTVFDLSATTGQSNDNKISAGSIGGAGDFLLGANQFTVGSANTSTTVDGVISGAGASLIKIGTGTLTLNNANTFDGGVTLNGGGISVGNDQALGPGTFTGISGTLDIQDTRVIGNAIDLLGDIAFNVNGAGIGTLSGNIGSSGPTAGFTKTGAGTLVLSGSNTYSGATTVDAGVLQIDTDASIPQTTDVKVNSGATLQISDGVAADINSLANGSSGGGTVRIGTSDPSTILYIGFNAGATTTFGGSILGPGNLEIDGGSLTLTGASNIGGDLYVCECSTLTISGPGASFTAAGSGFLNFLPGTEINGVLNVLAGATFSTDNLLIGGTMTADGKGTTVTATGLTFIGTNSIPASLTISGGAVMNSQGGAIIENPFENATVTVTGQGSTWKVDNGLYVGDGFGGAPGFLTVSAGGIVNVTGGSSIGADPLYGRGPSIVTVTGAGSAFNVDNLAIGYSCICADMAGTLNVADGGKVTATGTVLIGALGVLNIGTGALAGSIVVPAIGNEGQIVANFTDTSTLAANISGGGTLRKLGSGNLVLTGINTFTGATTVDAGKLTVNGSMTSAITVNSAGALGGTGTVADVTIVGGTLTPGNSIGTITIAGNLNFVGAGNYIVEVSPAAADRTNVTGTASLSGTVRATFAPGTYLPRTTYTILSATGGRNGTFGALDATGLPAFGASLQYTATDVNLVLGDVNIAGVAGLNRNQQAVANSIQGFYNAGGALPLPVLALVSLPNGALQNALTQASGEIATGVGTAGFQNMDYFLTLMLDPQLETRLGNGTVQGRALGFAPQSSVQAALPAELLSYNGLVTKAPPMTFEQRWTVWGAAAGGTGKFKGDAIIGSNNLDVRGGIFAAGIDYRFSPDTVVGFAVAGGSQTFGFDAVQGSGRSNSVQAGIYGSTKSGNAYLSAAAAYGRHDVSTERNVAFPGMFDRLTADFGADSFGGRIEGGYRFAAAGFGFTPYAALQAQRFQTPNYSEIDRTGILAFALNYAGQSWNDTRSELGARVDYRMMMESGTQLILRGRAAWAHEYDTGRAINAAFQALPGFGFTVTGASPAADLALVSAGAELKFRNGVALRAKFDGEFANRQNVYSGTGGVYVSW